MATETDKEQIIEDAKLLWAYAKHHKNQTMRYADFRHHFNSVEKIRITHDRLMAALEHMENEGMFKQVAPDAWRVVKPSEAKPKHSKKHRETMAALQSSVRDEEEPKETPAVEERITITPTLKREIKLSEDTILAQALDYVKEFPGCTSADLVQYFGITSNRATMMLVTLTGKKVVKRHQEERVIGKSKLGKDIRRKVWVYDPIEPIRNLVAEPVAKIPQPQRRSDDYKTNVRVTLSFTAASASIATMFYSYIKSNGGADLSMEVHDDE